MANFGVLGKYLARGREKFLVRGVSYGTFDPAETGGRFFPERTRVREDFRRMREANINTVRLYLRPPDDVMQEAREAGLAVVERAVSNLVALVRWIESRPLSELLARPHLG